MRLLHPTLTVSPLRPLSLRSGSAPGRPRYLSAASGLVATGRELCVIADDELHLGCFALQGERPGRLLRLLPGELPESPRRRKRRKPDLEVLLRLPPFPGLRHGAMLALGSGSGVSRRKGVLLPLDGKLRPTGRSQHIDAAPFFADLARALAAVNIDGGWVSGNRLYLLQRGNRGGAPNALIGWSLAPLLRTLVHERALQYQTPSILREMPLGYVDGVIVGFTDGTPLSDGSWMFSAVAEDTDDAYHDGELVGAFVGLAGPRHGLRWLRRIAPDYKVEGIAIDAHSRTPRLLMVTDADDPAQPAWLLEAKLPTC
jgi:hypothetical protein